ncbi:MAG: DUF1499 domain-containing protein [Rhodobacteraceae bacterium]|nr:DUF1499 domain-containing protein [Paracoccaceae bacterium]
MSRLAVSVVVVLVVAAGFLVWVRVAPTDAARWHVDPETAPKPSSKNWAVTGPNEKHAAPNYALTAADLAARFDSFALQQPRTRRIGGSPAEGQMTYEVRSKLVGYPDFVSVKAIDLGNGTSTLALFSRSRFGYGDQGVNAKRLRDWLRAFNPA